MVIKYIHIQNYKNIRDATITYKAGLWEVIGVNNDDTYTSNASGKSSSLEAIQQCLFNKTTLPIPIEDVGRKSSGGTHNFILTTEFSKDGSTYKVINDRSLMKITVIQDGEDLGLRSIPHALKRIQVIIGMDISTFITLTFITHTTISDLLDNFSSSALMKIILDFNQITDLDKRMKLEVKSLNDGISNANITIKSIDDSLEVLSKYKQIDTSAFHRQKANISAEIVQLSDEISTISSLLSVHKAHKLKLDELEGRLLKINDGICDKCGQTIDNDTTRDEILYEIEEVSTLIVAFDETSEDNLSRLKEDLRGKQEKVQILSAKIIAADTTNQIYEENKERSEDLRKLRQDAIVNKDNKLQESDIVTTAIQLIKKGDLHKHLMLSFVSVLNKYLTQFRSFINLPYVAISAEANKANVGFILHDTRFNQNIHMNTLSGGERTRLRLVLLLSMLYTIKDMTNASTNLLIFDESLDTLDVSASADLARLFEYLIAHDNKFIALISHGQQLQEIDFTGKITVTKTDGIATVKEETYE